jgi:hypothetical protein
LYTIFLLAFSFCLYFRWRRPLNFGKTNSGNGRTKKDWTWGKKIYFSRKKITGKYIKITRKTRLRSGV